MVRGGARLRVSPEWLEEFIPFRLWGVKYELSTIMFSLLMFVHFPAPVSVRSVQSGGHVCFESNSPADSPADSPVVEREWKVVACSLLFLPSTLPVSF